MASSPPPAPPATKPSPPSGPANSQQAPLRRPRSNEPPYCRCATSSCFPTSRCRCSSDGRRRSARSRRRPPTAGLLFLVAQRSADTEEPAAGDLHRVGVVARIVQATRQANGTARILVEGVARARVTRYVPAAGYLRAALADEADAPRRGSRGAQRPGAPRARAVRGVRLAPPPHPERSRRARSGRRLDRRGRHTASRRTSPCASRSGRRCSRHRTFPRCSTRSNQLLASEIELLRLERKLDEEVRGSLFQNQREFYLQEQLKAIHRELGQDEPTTSSDLERQIEARKLPEAVQDARAARGAQAAPDVAALARVHGRAKFRRLDRRAARGPSGPTTCSTSRTRGAMLDEDHYGLEEVKDRILDYIGVLSLVERMEGPILCLVGPPGVGKTSLGRSIARALGRKFVRMSLGGVRDEAEIRGHRRTYIGSMPGRVDPGDAPRRGREPGDPARRDRQARAATIAAIRRRRCSRCSTPSRIARSTITTSRSTTISRRCCSSRRRTICRRCPEPLRDRMEIIRLAGYLDQEKFAIARQFLVPKQLRLNGLDPDDVEWDTDVIPAIVQRYTREAGVRELERRIGRIARKLARARSRVARPRARRAPTPRRAEDDASCAPPTSRSCSASRRTIRRRSRSTTRSASPRGSPTRAVGGEVLEIEVSVVARTRQAAAHRHARRRDEGVGERGAQLRARARRACSASIASSIARATCTSTFRPAPRRRTDRRPASRSRRRSSARSPAFRCAATSR